MPTGGKDEGSSIAVNYICNGNHLFLLEKVRNLWNALWIKHIDVFCFARHVKRETDHQDFVLIFFCFFVAEHLSARLGPECIIDVLY